MPSGNYTDDPSVNDDVVLWRRVHPNHIIFDENLGRSRPTSAAFADHPNRTPMSVVISSDAASIGRTPADVLSGFKGFALAGITAGFVRSQNQGVVRCPTPDEPAHGEVFGSKPRSVMKALAKEAFWVVEPTIDSG
jgi:hypothetical protein